MKDDSDFLWGMYQEHTTQGRHHEAQRASVTNFIIIVAGGAIAFIANKGVTRDQWVLALFLIILGIFGALFSAKQYERFRFHMVAAGKYRKTLELLLKSNFGNIREEAKSEHEQGYSKFLVKLRLYYFWIVLHLLITVLGVMLLLMTMR
ncbi:MAG: hypothetical protein ABIN94_15195 [Ferruginibacter sp.]